MARKPKPAGDSKTDKFIDWSNHLINASRKRLILVSKKKDLDVLKTFGVHHVYWVKKPLYKALDAIVEINKDCILLFDTGKAGNEIAEKFKTLLEQNGVKVSAGYRKYLLVEHIQDVSNVFKHAMRRAGTDRKIPKF